MTRPSRFFFGFGLDRVASIVFTSQNLRNPDIVVTPTNTNMKRKHADESAPKGESEKRAKTQQPANNLSFADLGLDTRLVQAVAAESFKEPTPVQQKAIPLALDGNDVVAKAPCGSGKTASYVLPVLSSILKGKSVCYFPSGLSLYIC